MKENNRDYDVIILGGGPAGLSAALTLGRARRRVLVCDSGNYRNAGAPESHGFFSRDGIAPGELLRLGREDLRAYPTVEFRQGLVTQTVSRGDASATRFEVELCPAPRDCRDGDGRGQWLRARKLLLATGVRGELPPIPGLRECWGLSAQACPYCHGYEVRDQPIALLANGEAALDLATLLTGWSRDLVLCSNGPLDLPDEKKAWFGRHNIAVREERIARLEHHQGQLEAVRFENGDSLPRHALFLRGPLSQKGSHLLAGLGCEIKDGLLVLDMAQTTAPGVYAAGDATTYNQQLMNAATSGALAAAIINVALIRETLVAEELAATN